MIHLNFIDLLRKGVIHCALNECLQLLGDLPALFLRLLLDGVTCLVDTVLVVIFIDASDVFVACAQEFSSFLARSAHLLRIAMHPFTAQRQKSQTSFLRERHAPVTDKYTWILT